MKINDFKVRIFQKDGKFVGHAVAVGKPIPNSLEPEETSDDEKLKFTADFGKLSTEFMRSMLGYIDFVPLVVSVVSQFSREIVSKSIIEFVEARSEKKEATDDHVTYTLTIDHLPHFEQLQQTRASALTMRRQVPRSLTISLVASFEHHLNLLVRDILYLNKNLSGFEHKEMLVSHILACSSVDELKEAIFDRETDALFRKGFEEIITWIEKQVNIDRISPKFEEWEEIVEVFERRNLFVHANGIVNRQYLSNVDKTEPPRKLGDELGVSSEYFRNAVDNIINFGVRLNQVVWRKLEKAQSESADDELNRISYELIIRGEYVLAEKILQFGIALRDTSSERSRRIMIVNLANVTKLKGDEKAALSILNKYDWSMASDDFETCIAAIKGNVRKVVEKMRAIGSKGCIAAHEYQEWPAFYHVRDATEFKDTFRDLFGYEFVGSNKNRGGAAELIRLLGSRNEDGRPETSEAGGEDAASDVLQHRD